MKKAKLINIDHELFEKIEEQAINNNRTVTGEIIFAIQESVNKSVKKCGSKCKCEL
jgi:hypothetical protein